MRLSAFADGLDRVAEGSVEQALKDRLVPVVQSLIQAGFSSETDPYGIPWAPRKNGGSWPILDKTGVMKSTVAVTTTPEGVRAEFAAPYSGYHQTGTSKMVARRPVPTESRGLGTWRDEFERLFDETMVAQLTRAA